MHHTKTGAINSSSILASSIRTDTPYTRYAVIHCATSLNLAHPTGRFFNFAMSYHVCVVHALFPIYKSLVILTVVSPVHCPDLA